MIEFFAAMIYSIVLMDKKMQPPKDIDAWFIGIPWIKMNMKRKNYPFLDLEKGHGVGNFLRFIDPVHELAHLIECDIAAVLDPLFGTTNRGFENQVQSEYNVYYIQGTIEEYLEIEHEVELIWWIEKKNIEMSIDDIWQALQIKTEAISDRIAKEDLILKPRELTLPSRDKNSFGKKISDQVLASYNSLLEETK